MGKGFGEWIWWSWGDSNHTRRNGQGEAAYPQKDSLVRSTLVACPLAVQQTPTHVLGF